MHEFPEVQAMVQSACKQAPKDTRITRLTIVVGEASGHDPHHIQEHFIEASRGTAAEGALLEFVREMLAATCVDCGTSFETGSMALSCAKCGGRELSITAGKDVHLAKVEFK